MATPAVYRPPPAEALRVVVDALKVAVIHGQHLPACKANGRGKGPEICSCWKASAYVALLVAERAVPV